MTSLDTRLNRLAAPDAVPVNPVSALTAYLALVHPDYPRLKAQVAEAIRTGRLPADPLFRAFAYLIHAANAAYEAGLFQSAAGEQLCQVTEEVLALLDKQELPDDGD